MTLMSHKGIPQKQFFLLVSEFFCCTFFLAEVVGNSNRVYNPWAICVFVKNCPVLISCVVVASCVVLIIVL